ncbi:MAG: phospholipid carrier-dependent glycosyltransferase [Janthinobacterium lividum]
MGRDLLKLCALLTVVFGFMLGERSLSTPDEGRYAEIPREMVTTGDYITPRLNGIKYFEKPPLMYWAEAFVIKNLGLTEFSLRLLPAFLGIIGCLWIFGIVYSLFGRTEAWASSLILASSLLYYVHTRLLILDLGVTVFLSIALFSFLKASLSFEFPKQQNKWLIGFYVGSALAMMTKGMIGAVIPGAIILLWTILGRRWDILKLAFKPWGILLFLALTAPWHILVSIENPEFPYFYFIHEHFVRFASRGHGRRQAWWFFLAVLSIGFFPWTAFLVQATRDVSKKISKDIFQFLIIWIGFVFIFFSLSNSKLIPYILTLFPPLAVLMGIYIGSIWRDNRNTFGFVMGVQIYRLCCALMIVILPIVVFTQDLLPVFTQHWITGEIMVLCLVIGCLTPGYFISKGRPRFALTSLVAGSMTVFICLNTLWPGIENRSIKSLALKILETKKPADKVIGYERYYQDLPVYLNQIILIHGWVGELGFGIDQEDMSAIVLSQEQFKNLWQGPEKVYAVMRRDSFARLQTLYPNQIILCDSTEKDVLVINHQ